MRASLADRRASHRLVAAATGWWLLACLPAQTPAHATVLNPTTYQWVPTFVQRGDFVHAFAIDATTIFHARSADGGRTWPLREHTLGPFVNYTNGGDLPEIVVHTATHAGALLVLGHDVTFGPRVVRSTNDGASWTQPIPVASFVFVDPMQVMRPRLHADGANVVVAWTNSRPTGRVFCNRSTDFGATWQPNDTRLDVGLTLGPAVNRVVVLGSGQTVHVLWDDGQVRRQRSLDGGATWLPAAAGLTGLPFASGLYDAVGDGVALLALLGSTLVRSGNAGDTWSVVGNHGVHTVWAMAMQGNLAVVAGKDSATPSPNNFVNVSTDGGATWPPVPLQLPSGGAAVFPHAYVDGGAVYVNWEVVGFPGNVIRSDDGGATWQVLEGPVQSGFSPGPVRTIHTARTYVGSGTFRYHAYVGVGSTLLGSGSTGSGSIVPSLATNGLPVQGRSTLVQVADTVGGAPGALGFSFAPPAAVPFLGATVYLGTLDVLVGFVAAGSSGQPGAGSFGLPLPIPVAPTLVGTSLVVQAMVLDTGVPTGFAVSNAIELWLR